MRLAKGASLFGLAALALTGCEESNQQTVAFERFGVEVRVVGEEAGDLIEGIPVTFNGRDERATDAEGGVKVGYQSAVGDELTIRVRLPKTLWTGAKTQRTFRLKTGDDGLAVPVVMLVDVEPRRDGEETYVVSVEGGCPSSRVSINGVDVGETNAEGNFEKSLRRKPGGLLRASVAATEGCKEIRCLIALPQTGQFLRVNESCGADSEQGASEPPPIARRDPPPPPPPARSEPPRAMARAEPPPPPRRTEPPPPRRVEPPPPRRVEPPPPQKRVEPPPPEPPPPEPPPPEPPPPEPPPPEPPPVEAVVEKPAGSRSVRVRCSPKGLDLFVDGKLAVRSCGSRSKAWLLPGVRKLVLQGSVDGKVCPPSKAQFAEIKDSGRLASITIKTACELDCLDYVRGKLKSGTVKDQDLVCLQEANPRKSDFLSSKLLLAHVHLGKGELGDAERVLTEVTTTRVGQTDPEVRARLAEILGRRKKLADASEEAEKAWRYRMKFRGSRSERETWVLTVLKLRGGFYEQLFYDRGDRSYFDRAVSMFDQLEKSANKANNGRFARDARVAKSRLVQQERQFLGE